MTEQSGRDFLILQGGTAIGGLRETSVTVNSEPVDITNKGDSGYRTLASFAGTEAIDISGSGVFQGTAKAIRDTAFAGTGTTKLLTDITIEWGDGATLSGDFYLSSTESGGNHDGEETYSITLQSSGAWTYTAAV